MTTHCLCSQNKTCTIRRDNACGDLLRQDAAGVIPEKESAIAEYWWICKLLKHSLAYTAILSLCVQPGADALVASAPGCTAGGHAYKLPDQISTRRKFIRCLTYLSKLPDIVGNRTAPTISCVDWTRAAQNQRDVLQ